MPPTPLYKHQPRACDLNIITRSHIVKNIAKKFIPKDLDNTLSCGKIPPSESGCSFEHAQFDALVATRSESGALDVRSSECFGPVVNCSLESVSPS